MADPTPATGADQGGAHAEAALAEFLHERFALEHEPHWRDLDEYEQRHSRWRDIAHAITSDWLAARLADEREAALLDAAEELDAQPPKLKAQYVEALRLYAAEPGRMQVRAARIAREGGQR